MFSSGQQFKLFLMVTKNRGILKAINFFQSSDKVDSIFFTPNSYNFHVGSSLSKLSQFWNHAFLFYVTQTTVYQR